MNYEIKDSFKQTIQSSTGIYKSIFKKLSSILIAIIEDPRKRCAAISNKFIELVNLDGQYWCINRKIHTHCILKRIANEKDKIEFAKEFIVRIKFWWGNDVIKFLEADYLLIPAETMEAWDHETMTYCLLDRKITTERRWDKREIIFHPHPLLDILEIIDICKIFPQESCEIYFIGMKNNDISQRVIELPKADIINENDPRDDKFIKSECSNIPEVKQYLNKDETELMTDSEVLEKYSFLCSLGFEVPLAWRVKKKELPQVSY